MAALNRHRWPLPHDPSGPPMTYPEPMPTYMPFMTPPTMAAPPTPMAQAPAAPADWQLQGMITPETRGAPTTPEASPEDEQFNRQMEEEQLEADWTRMTTRATAVLKVEAEMQKARNAVAKAIKEAKQRPSIEAPDEPLDKVFDRYVKGHAPMPTFEEYKASVRAPSGAEALSWTEEAPELQDFYSAGGTPEELRGIRKEEADRITLEKYAPQYVAPFQDLTFGEGRELVGKQREHREATMAPIREKLAGIRERRKELRRLRKPPTWKDIFEQQQTVAAIKAGPPTTAKVEDPRHLRGQRLGWIDNQIQDARAELAEHDKLEPGFWSIDRYNRDEWQEIRDKLVAKLEKLEAEGRNVAGLEGSSELTEEIARQILAEAGGDKERARQIARQRGYNF